MAMKKAMTVDQARAMAQQAAIGLKKWGAQYSPPYAKDQLVEALGVLENAGNWDGPTKAELTKANRQLAACNARYERLKNRQSAKDAEFFGDNSLKNRGSVLTPSQEEMARAANLANNPDEPAD